MIAETLFLIVCIIALLAVVIVLLMLNTSLRLEIKELLKENKSFSDSLAKDIEVKDPEFFNNKHNKL